MSEFGWVRPVAERSIVGSLVAAALVGVVSVIVGDFGDISWKAMGTIALFVFFAISSWYDADVSAKRSARFGGASVLVSLYLLFVGLAKLWLPGQDDDFFGLAGWIGLVIVARLALLHVHLLLVLYRKFTSELMRLLSRVTFTLVALLATGLSLPLLYPNAEFPDWFYRMTWAIAILDTLGTILVPLLHSMFGPKSESLPTASTSARLAWPRYEDGRPLPIGADGQPDFSGVVDTPTSWLS